MNSLMRWEFASVGPYLLLVVLLGGLFFLSPYFRMKVQEWKKEWKKKNRMACEAEWLKAGVKIRKWAGGHPTGQLEVLESGSQPGGAKVLVVVWRFGERVEEVFSMYFSPGLSPRKITLNVSYSNGARDFLDLPRYGFQGFVDYSLQKEILNFTSPLSR